jgi:hypothetical protein
VLGHRRVADDDGSGLNQPWPFLGGGPAALFCGATTGPPTLAFRSQSGLAAEVTDATTANNLIANGYGFYGAYATAAQGFLFAYPGSISGLFLWADSYINQIWLNNQLQLALMTLLSNAKSIPYNTAGYSLIRAAMQDPINQALNFGAIRAGVTLSASQAAQINNAVGGQVAQVVQTQGWYVDIQNATPQVRAARGTPPIVFYYMDGQSVQKITLASVEVQ